MRLSLLQQSPTSMYFYNAFNQSESQAGAPLDDYLDIILALSFRKLISSYNGNCIRLRRSSDSLEADFGFVANYVDINSILAFIGNDTAYVVKWYNQYNPSNSAFQTTESYQPVIAVNGELNYVNGKLAIKNDGEARHYLLLTNASLTDDTAIFCTYRSSDTTPGMLFSANQTKYIGVMQSGSSSSAESEAGAPSYYVNGSLLLNKTRGGLFSSLSTGGMKCITINNALFNGGGWAYEVALFGYNAPYDFGQVCDYNEIIFATPIGDKIVLENDIISYYGI